jgi:hypothetical protein
MAAVPDVASVGHVTNSVLLVSQESPQWLCLNARWSAAHSSSVPFVSDAQLRRFPSRRRAGPERPKVVQARARAQVVRQPGAAASVVPVSEGTQALAAQQEAAAVAVAVAEVTLGRQGAAEAVQVARTAQVAAQVSVERLAQAA